MTRLFSTEICYLFVLANTFFGMPRIHAQDQAEMSRSLHALTAYLSGRDTHEDNIKCGFSTIAAALGSRETLRADMRMNLEQVLQRPLTQTSIVIGNFRIHFDTIGVNTPAILDSIRNPLPGGYRVCVDSVGAIANYVLGYETGVLGYLPPPSDNGSGGGNEYDIYITNLGRSYGYTDPETEVIHKPNGSTWTSFIVIDNDFEFVSPRRNIGLPALRVTLAHEFHHAIQMGSYGLWSGHEYFYEITSTWMEDVLYTEVNDYLQYLFDHFRRPNEPFTKFEVGSNIQYSRCIWGHYVAKRFGREVMRMAWNSIQTVPPLQAMDDALQRDTSSFRQALSEWCLWNFFTGTRADSTKYYPEGNLYPQVTQKPAYFMPPSSTHPDSLSALGARYHRIIGRPDTLVLVIANTNLAAGLSGSTVQFPYSLSLSSYRVDNSYRPTLVDSLYLKLGVVDPVNWSSQDIFRDSTGSPIVGSSSVASGSAFPNPWFTSSSKPVSIAVDWPANSEGMLSVFTSSMDLVYSSGAKTEIHENGKHVIKWNGRTSNGETPRTGVYLFILEGQNQTIIGKIAVVRK